MIILVKILLPLIFFLGILFCNIYFLLFPFFFFFMAIIILVIFFMIRISKHFTKPDYRLMTPSLKTSQKVAQTNLVVYPYLNRD